MYADIQVGQVLDDRFKILDLIHRGGMARIFEALDIQQGGTVALKIPLMQFECDPGFFSRFQREETIGRMLCHPCIARYIPTQQPKSRPYLVMEHLEGRTLKQRLAETRPLPEAEAVRIASQVCEGLDYLHRHGVVHRDLKPDNIMLCDDDSVRIIDFGIAKVEQARRLTFGSLSPTMGTPDYIAPEQVQGKRGDPRTDIYALGAILYEMTTGVVPYKHGNLHAVMNARLFADPEAPRKRNPRLTLEAEEIILHALERNPAGRFPSAGAMKVELDDYSEVSVTGRCERLQPPRPWRTGFQLLPKVAAFAAAQIILFFLLFWSFSHSKHGGSALTVRSGPVESNPQSR